MASLDHSHPTKPMRRRRTDAEITAEVARLENLAKTLDARFRIPLTGFRVGLDGLIGLIPGVGDTLAALPSAYLIARGWQLGAKKRTLARMSVNTGLDWMLGSIPIVGDLFDIGFKGNLRNVRLLQSDLRKGQTAYAAQGDIEAETHRD
ncbi:DUF4112 domain-containing protein [Tritonibacter sp. SIMBA_163]|uniref:DUF4112 domain-containing protein n=1 Tax=Tritonibacter sp. SIMBA_163 TaxID=3080868 RepID=UPI00398186AE